MSILLYEMMKYTTHTSVLAAKRREKKFVVPFIPLVSKYECDTIIQNCAHIIDIHTHTHTCKETYKDISMYVL